MNKIPKDNQSKKEKLYIILNNLNQEAVFPNPVKFSEIKHFLEQQFRSFDDFNENDYATLQ